MLADFNKKYENYLNADQELKRRLAGFKTFSGVPDGHYKRAREQGASATARAVKCYPFGGSSLLGDCEAIGIHLTDAQQPSKFVVHLKDQKFSIENGDWNKPHLTIELSNELFWKTVLGRYRWLFAFGFDGVEVEYSDHLPHSDWITLLEILVAMQELVEFDPDLWQKIESQF